MTPGPLVPALLAGLALTLAACGSTTGTQPTSPASSPPIRATGGQPVSVYAEQMKQQVQAIAATIAPGQSLTPFTDDVTVSCGHGSVHVNQSLQVKVPAGVTPATFATITAALTRDGYVIRQESAGLIAQTASTGQGMSVLDQSTGGVGLIRFNTETQCGLPTPGTTPVSP